MPQPYSMGRSYSITERNHRTGTTTLYPGSKGPGMTGTLGRTQTHTYRRETTYQSTASASAQCGTFVSPLTDRLSQELNRRFPQHPNIPGLQARPKHNPTTISRTEGTLPMKNPFHREVPVTVVDTRLPSAPACRQEPRLVSGSIGPNITVTRSGESSRPCPAGNGTRGHTHHHTPPLAGGCIPNIRPTVHISTHRASPPPIVPIVIKTTPARHAREYIPQRSSPNVCNSRRSYIRIRHRPSIGLCGASFTGLALCAVLVGLSAASVINIGIIGFIACCSILALMAAAFIASAVYYSCKQQSTTLSDTTTTPTNTEQQEQQL